MVAVTRRPSALGAGTAGVGAWETAVQVLAPVQTASVASPPINSAIYDLSGSGDSVRGADQTKSRSRSFARCPSDAGSGGGFSVSSAGGESAAASRSSVDELEGHSIGCC